MDALRFIRAELRTRQGRRECLHATGTAILTCALGILLSGYAYAAGGLLP